MVKFRSFRSSDRATVMALLDANIPTAFAANERPAFETFLDRVSGAYQVAFEDERAIAAFLLILEAAGRGRINWFMAHPDAHGRGLGKQMMEAVRADARAQGLAVIDIAASHVSEGFYAKFGATVLSRTAHGWGPDMHRVDMEWAV